MARRPLDTERTSPPVETPSDRALHAMESAVRRARESTEAGASRPPATPPLGTQTPDTPPMGTRSRATRSGGAARAPAPPPTAGQPRTTADNRLLKVSVLLAAFLVLAAAIALVVSLTTSSGTPAHAGTARAHAGTAARAHPGTTAPVHPGTTAPPATSTTAPPATPGGAPQISALSPATGGPGQSIQVQGANFMSSSGQIVASFNGQAAPTSCPSQSTCTVTVPPSSGSPTAQVTIGTAAGVSNAVTFTYG